MTEHTPGPWEVNGRAIEQVAKPSAVICYLEDEQTDEWHANALLIAAAPDLVAWAEDAAHCLEAYIVYSQEMRKYGRGFSPSGLAGHTTENVVEGLRAAIRKAKGEGMKDG